MDTTNNKRDDYRKWCEENEAIPLFHQAFWLDLVCGENNWEVLLNRAKNGAIIGALPYFFSKRFGLTTIQNPPLTPFLGPYIEYSEDVLQSGKISTKYHFEIQVLEELIAQLPHSFYLSNSCLPQLTNALPFYWAGFDYLTFYTYLIYDLKNLEQVKSGFKGNIRRNIRKAENQLVLEKNIDSATFFSIHKMTFDRQNLAAPFSFSFFQRLEEGIQKNKVGQKFAAKDAAGNVHAVAYLLWDKQRAYYYLAGENPIFRGSGASVFLIWEAIQFTRNELGLTTFDFAGSMIKNIEIIRRQFGATQVPYFYMSKSRNRWVEIAVSLLKKRM